MNYLPFLFNIVLLLFWVRLWAAPDKEFYFNPFLSGTVRLTDTILAFLRPVLFLPEQAAALALILFTVVFKTLLMARLNIVWELTFGLDFRYTPSATDSSWGLLLLFSAYHFASFLLKFWCVYLLVKFITPAHRVTRATEALDFFARPFSRLPLLAQPFVLILLQVVLAFAVSRTGVLNVVNPLSQETKTIAVSPFLSGPLFAQLLKTGWLAALAMADSLALLIRALFVLIIGNLGAAVFQSQGALILCNEGIELLMGRFARNRATTLGMGIDFTPLIFFFVVDMVYRGICVGIGNLINSPFFN